MPRLNRPRVDPVQDDALEGEAKEILERHRQNGRVLNIFRTLVHHPKLMKRWTVFGNHVLFKSSLSARDRELVILRIGWLCQSEYEFGQHTVIGKQAGITDEEIRRVTAGPDADGWTPVESVLLRAVDELHEDSFISDATWAELSKHYSTEQLMDVVFATGQYTLVSMALNSLGVQLDEGVPGFPK